MWITSFHFPPFYQTNPKYIFDKMVTWTHLYNFLKQQIIAFSNFTNHFVLNVNSYCQSKYTRNLIYYLITLSEVCYSLIGAEKCGSCLLKNYTHTKFVENKKWVILFIYFLYYHMLSHFFYYLFNIQIQFLIKMFVKDLTKRCRTNVPYKPLFSFCQLLWTVGLGSCKLISSIY